MSRKYDHPPDCDCDWCVEEREEYEVYCDRKMDEDRIRYRTGDGK